MESVSRQRPDDWDAVAQALRDRMTELRITQSKLSAASNIGVSTIQELTAGKVRDRLPHVLPSLSKALEWPSDRLDRVLRGDSIEASTLRDAATDGLDALADKVDDLSSTVDEQIGQLRDEVGRIGDQSSSGIATRIDELQAEVRRLQEDLRHLYDKVGQPYPRRRTDSTQRPVRKSGT